MGLSYTRMDTRKDGERFGLKSLIILLLAQLRLQRTKSDQSIGISSQVYE